MAFKRNDCWCLVPVSTLKINIFEPLVHDDTTKRRPSEYMLRKIYFDKKNVDAYHKLIRNGTSVLYWDTDDSMVSGIIEHHVIDYKYDVNIFTIDIVNKNYDMSTYTEYAYLSNICINTNYSMLETLFTIWKSKSLRASLRRISIIEYNYLFGQYFVEAYMVNFKTLFPNADITGDDNKITLEQNNVRLWIHRLNPKLMDVTVCINYVAYNFKNLNDLYTGIKKIIDDAESAPPYIIAHPSKITDNKQITDKSINVIPWYKRIFRNNSYKSSTI